MIRAVAHKLLDIPAVFDSYQWVIGAPECHRRFMLNHVAARPGQRVLDVGCGVGAGLRYLPAGVDYVGVDISAPYIERATRDHGASGRFICADVTVEDPAAYGSFDLAYAFGVMHHLSDEQIGRLIGFLERVLRPGARFVTIDPCYRDGQDSMARYLISQDRGEHVRDRAGYEALFAPRGAVNSTYVEDVLRIPYTQLIVEFAPHAAHAGNA